MIFFNRCFDKNRLKIIINLSLMNFGEKKTIELVESLKNVGFEYATKAGVSLSLDDLQIPLTKTFLISKSEFNLSYNQQEYNSGNITDIEKFQLMIDTWHQTSEKLRIDVVDYFKSTNIFNPIYMMAFSGARGNISQVRQLVGMRGLMADPQGQIIDYPIRSNFKEGLTLTEYIISCYGARKGLVDTALRTANSGYLTRRLVDVAQHLLIYQSDCSTVRGIWLKEMQENRKIIIPLKARLLGRVLADTIILNNKKIVSKNTDISLFLANQISTEKKEVFIRSPLTCQSKNAICQLCYGWSLAHGNIVSIGEAVGILAAQSIGEPGTQLTMRTFHTGGVFSGNFMDLIQSPCQGIVYFLNSLEGSLIRTSQGKIAFLTKKEGKFFIKSPKSIITTYFIPSSTVLFVRQGEKVFRNQLLAEISSLSFKNNKKIQSTQKLITKVEGEIFFENVAITKITDKDGNLVEKTAFSLGSICILLGKIYKFSLSSLPFPKKGDLFNKNVMLNQSLLRIPFNGLLDSQLEKKHNSLLVKKLLISFCIKNIKYKKLGYYFSSFSKKIKGNFFSPYSLFPKPFFKKKNSFYFFNDFYKKKYIKVFYINVNYFSRFLNLGYFLVVSKQKFKLFNKTYEKNSLFLHICFYGFSNNLFNSKTNIKIINLFLQNKKNKLIQYKLLKNVFFSFKLKNFNKKNYLNISKSLNKSSKFKISKNIKKIENNENLKEKISLKKIKSFKQKNYKKTFYINPYVSSSKKIYFKNSYKTNVFLYNFTKKNKTFIKINKNKRIFYKINSGWIYRLTNNQISLKLHKSFINSGKKLINNLVFDKYLTYVQYFLENNKIQLKKNIFIKNEFIPYFFNLEKKSSKLKKYIKVNKKKKNYKFTFNFLWKKNLKAKWVIKFYDKANINYLIIISKALQDPFENSYKIKKSFYIKNNKISKILSNKYEEKIYNKQKISSNLYINLGFDIKIQNIKYIENLKSKFNFGNFFKYLIVLNVNKKSPLKITNIYFKNNYNNFIKNKKNIFFLDKNISFNRNFEILISRKLQIPFITKDKKNISTDLNKIFFYKNYINKVNDLKISSTFLSPFIGEILSKKNYYPDQDLEDLEVENKLKYKTTLSQNCLILTEKDQINYLTENKIINCYIRDIVRIGDEIIVNYCSSESGQIIQIDEKQIILRRAECILFSSGCTFHMDHGDFIEKNSLIITLFYQRIKTGDIVQGIPKIEEIFEARHTKEGEIISGTLHNKLQQLQLKFKRKYSSQEAVRKSLVIIQQLLVDDVQSVYQSQGVSLSDKHIEIIIKQMTSKVKIVEGGQTGLLRGELVDLDWIELVNGGIDIQKAEYLPIILGITKASLETQSFISAASFQETTKILSKAAIERKTDFLRGLKENVILGHLIPAGTGYKRRLNTLARSKKKLMLN
uniref:DNA-directed RNA polymerase subunit beta'' n=1 Tax=Koliella corcontica TaxID=155904 RepID=A0A097KMX1_9CHLO|nr:beta'' subunit of RNA polymerase [Koliella corcontica]AIT94520.1 beta'' subunit of RNA polymerase [Koliella corcontica]